MTVVDLMWEIDEAPYSSFCKCGCYSCFSSLLSVGVFFVSVLMINFFPVGSPHYGLRVQKPGIFSLPPPRESFENCFYGSCGSICNLNRLGRRGGHLGDDGLLPDPKGFDGREGRIVTDGGLKFWSQCCSCPGWPLLVCPPRHLPVHLMYLLYMEAGQSWK
jgi:hypothetical protein